jgi:tRNA (guanine37-N1)-methyltransferase
VQPYLDASILGHAIGDGRLDVQVTDLRGYATDRHRTVDDAPYGGGDGMVLKCEPTVAAIEAVSGPEARVIALSPRGRRLDHTLASDLSRERQLVLVCGRYAGLDERILQEARAEELSIGDYVLSGGEAAALVVTEVVTRLVPGILGNPTSPEQDSFAQGVLEHPVYTRPRGFRGREVPEVLLSGNHLQIKRFRRKQSLRLTRQRRPDLLEGVELCDEDREILRELENE